MTPPTNDGETPGLYDVATFWELTAERAAASAGVPMLFDGTDRVVTFDGLRDWAERVAAGLKAAGVNEDSVVAWQLPTRVEAIVLMLALARLGVTQVPIIALYREREIASMLRQSGASWLLVPSEWNGVDYAEMAGRTASDAPHHVEVLVVDDLPDGDPGILVAPRVDGDAVRWIYSTSGTTSEPKAVRHSDASLIAGGVALSIARAPLADDIGMIAYPFAHIGGPLQLVTALTHGEPLLLMDRFVPELAIDLMRRYAVTSGGGSTAFYLAFIKEQRRQPGIPIVPTLRYLAGGGAPMPPDVFWQLRAELGIPATHGYGMTECPMICSGTLTDSDEQLAHTVGVPLHAVELQVRDDAGSVVPNGVDGDVWVRGPMVFKGYVDAELTARSFDDAGFFSTGDRGHLRTDGHFVITGRTKELIIRKGENISPLEVEAVLQEHPKVAAVAVIGLPDPERGEYVCAVVELVDPADPLEFADMQAHCLDGGLMIQKVPERLEVVDALPRNPTMKILKTELKKRFDGPVR